MLAAARKASWQSCSPQSLWCLWCLRRVLQQHVVATNMMGVCLVACPDLIWASSRLKTPCPLYLFPCEMPSLRQQQHNRSTVLAICSGRKNWNERRVNSVRNDKDLVICWETTVHNSCSDVFLVMKKNRRMCSPSVNTLPQPELQPDARLSSLCFLPQQLSNRSYFKLKCDE